MNYSLILGFKEWGMGLLEKIKSFFDIIPKVIYFIYAAIASGIDAMQALVRKLAGLDIYYMNGTTAGDGGAIVEKDPLTEFIFGILGLGEHSAVYKALNTVFWSLAIFGLIILVVTTMVAIIKSHYNEDTAGTSPWKYVYTAIKAILTFAIIPITVVIGLQMAGLVLRTLDQITAGAGSSEQMTTMFGPAAKEFDGQQLKTNGDKKDDDGSGSKVYSNYDFFGASAPSRTTTFSGMLFKASAYQANRARSGYFSLDDLAIVKSKNGISIFVDGGAGQDANGGQVDDSNIININTLYSEEQDSFYTDITDSKDENIFMQPYNTVAQNSLAYAADKVDYAFSNCLKLTNSISYRGLVNTWKSKTRVFELTDIFGMIDQFQTFSKWNPSIVWLFYDLWQLNFIVAFAGAFSMFTIMISIIIGLMTRLIKGAALFLVYPSLLGIAPLDNFRAFKSWGTNFMQQVMMAFGSIIGMNLLLLILPYVQNIAFFNIAPVDLVVNVVLIIAGLLMAKDFITIVSGFVGGADANSIGGSMKGEVAGSIKKGVSMTAKTGALGARLFAKPAQMAIGGGVAVARRIKNRKNRDVTRQAKTDLDSATKAQGRAQSDLDSANANMDEYVKKVATGKDALGNAAPLSAEEQAIQKRSQKVYNKAIAEGKTDGEAAQIRDEFAKKMLNENTNKSVEQLKLEKNVSTEEAKVEKATNTTKTATEKFEEAKKTEVEGYIKSGVKINFNGKKGQANTKLGKMKSELTEDDFTEDQKKKLIPVFGQDAKGKQAALGALKKMKDGFFDSVSAKHMGKSIADAFLKTMEESNSGLGFDKIVKGAGEIFTPSMTLKGGSFDPSQKKDTGDKLVQSQGDKREAEAKEQKRILNDILMELKNQNGKNNGGGN